MSKSLGLNDGGTATRAVQHDVRGNITALGGLSMVYDYSDQMRNFSGSTRDHDGQVVSVTNGTYTYNGEGKRVRSVIDGVTTWFAYDHRGKLTYTRKSNADTTSKIYLETGQLLAKQAGSKITFMHSDHLGTPIRGTAGSGHPNMGAEVFAEFYTPFGMQPTQGWLGNTGSGLYGSGGLNAGKGSNAGVTGFTDHTFDAETGLTYMQARHYDPVAGRFLSVDPVTFMQDGRTGMFGRYSYTLNDPVMQIDPSGLFSVDAETARRYPEAAKKILSWKANSDVVSALSKAAGVSEEKAAAVFEPGQGPNIVGSVMGNSDFGSFAARNSFVDQAGLPVPRNDDIQVNNLLLHLANKGDIVAMTALFVTVMHETTHYLNDDPEASEDRTRVRGELAGEEGYAFEVLMFDGIPNFTLDDSPPGITEGEIDHAQSLCVGLEELCGG